MAAYVVFTRERLRDPSQMQVYAEKAGPSLEGHPVKSLAVYGDCETLEGEPIEGAVILEFPSVAAAKAWYEGPLYKAARQHRFKGADYRAFIVEGV